MSAHGHSTYKRTEAGVIPDDWCVATLNDICTFENGDRGKNYPSPDSFVSNGIPFINAGHIADGEIDCSEMNYITPRSFSRLGSGKIRRGDILFCLRGSIGKFGVVSDSLGDGAIASSLVIIRPKTSSIYAEYLNCYFSSQLCSRMIQTWSGGAAQPNLGAQDLAKFAISLPAHQTEQRAIAATLFDMDALISGLGQLIAKKRDIKQAAMQKLLTGQQRLPGFSGEWKLVVLGNLLTMKATYGIVTAGDFKNTGVQMMRGGDIKGGRIAHDLPFVTQEKSNEHSRTILKQDDVVISLVGYPGEAAKVPVRLEGANISRAVGLLRLNHLIAPDYLVSYLNSSMGRRMVLAPSAGSAQLVVNLMALNKMEFLLPPRPEQTAIASILSDMDSELAILEARRSKARQVKQGMMQQLLTGRIRLSQSTEETRLCRPQLA